MRKLSWLVITLGLLLFLPVLSSACNEGGEHENMTATNNPNSLTGMTLGIKGVEEERSSAHQILEVMLGINSFLLNILMLTGIYWLIKSAKRNE